MILGYPRATKTQLKARLAELVKLRINKVSFYGQTQLGKLCVLGKGYTGVVVLAKMDSKVVALKIKRTDSPRKSMQDETRLLMAANSVGVGPKLIKSSKNFLVMEYLNGKKFLEWMYSLKGRSSATKLKQVIKKILTDCYLLDSAGIDHGELSNITKHVIVGTKTTIIDFESSSLVRRVSNVTSATQAIFIGSGIAKLASKVCKIPPKQKIISALRAYKMAPSDATYNGIIRVLKL